MTINEKKNIHVFAPHNFAKIIKKDSRHECPIQYCVNARLIAIITETNKITQKIHLPFLRIFITIVIPVISKATLRVRNKPKNILEIDLLIIMIHVQ